MSIKLEKDEYIIFIARRHWFVLLSKLTGLIVLFFVPFALLLYIGKFDLNLNNFILGNVVFILSTVISTLILVLWISLFIVWTNYFLDTLILTNKKLVDIQQYKLFSRRISSFRLDRIQDITIEIKGVIATFLNFGNIHIQTAGEKRRFVLKSANRPAKVKEKILKAQQNVIERNDDSGGLL